MAKSCPRCNQQNADDDKYCGKCGRSLDNQSELVDPSFRDAVPDDAKSHSRCRSAVELEILESVRDRALKWFRFFVLPLSIAATVVFGVFGWLGFTSIQDVWRVKVDVVREMRKAQEDIETLRQETRLAIQWQDNKIDKLDSRVESVQEEVGGFRPSVDPKMKQKLNQLLLEYRSRLVQNGFEVPDVKPCIEVNPQLEADKEMRGLGQGYYDSDKDCLILSPSVAENPARVLALYNQHILRRYLKNRQLLTGIGLYLARSFNELSSGQASADSGSGQRPSCVNDLQNTNRFVISRDGGDPWANWKAWGGAFWSMRQELGEKMTVKLLAATLKAVKEAKPPISEELVEQVFGDTLLAQAQQMEQGRPAAKVRDILEKRGFKFTAQTKIQ